VEPFLAAFRTAVSPRSFRNAEWVAISCPTGTMLLETFRARVKRVLETRG